MDMAKWVGWWARVVGGIGIAVLALAACAVEQSRPGLADTLPSLAPVELAGRKLHAVATTSIVADVVGQVGGDRIEIESLMPPGLDPHSYTPAPDDLKRLNDADVIFVNGLALEESLLPVLGNLDRPVPVVEVNVGVTPRVPSEEGDDGHEEEEHEHGGVDPHTWFNPANVKIWAQNIGDALAALDPAQAEAYAAAVSAYQAQLDTLDGDLRATLAGIPEERRKLVTDHDDLGYLADAYGFTIIGSVIPSLSTMAAASAQELARLQDQIEAAGVPAIFVGTTVNPQVAQQMARDLGIVVIPIYTDSLSEADGPAATYLELMRSTVKSIAEALQ